MLTRRPLQCVARFTASASASQIDPKEIVEPAKRPAIKEVKSMNAATATKSLYEMASIKSRRSPAGERLHRLPAQAVPGLRNALLATEINPKQLQNEADQLFERLKHRRFPASSEMLKGIRMQLKKELRRKAEDERISGDQLESEADEVKIKRQSDKLLRKADYKWAPLDVNKEHDAVVYALARLAPNYAEISRVIAEFARADGFSPKTVLDFGCGTGAGFWAVHDAFGLDVDEYLLVDASDAMTRLAVDLMRDESMVHPNGLIHPNVNVRRHFLPSLQTTYDLVIAHRTLSEVGSNEARLELLRQLWQRTNRFLVLIEDSKRDAFESILTARDFVVTEGQALDLEATRRLLAEHNFLDEAMDRLLHDGRLSEYERLELIKAKLPADFALPTAMDPGFIFAPCPHDMGCPKQIDGKCLAPIRWEAVRADGKTQGRHNDNTDEGSISYVILEKGSRAPGSLPGERILQASHSAKHSTCDVCTAFNGVQRFTLTKKHRNFYQGIRARRAGDLLPFAMRKLEGDDPFDKFML
ncbi:unnamed protein product, partial [Mesorhabditis spiculigera]